MTETDARFVISRKAVQDLATIYEYSARTWGEVQARSYENDVWSAIHLIARYPTIGRQTPAHGALVRGWLVGEHRLFYLSQSTGVLVLRIAHQRQFLRARDLMP